MIPPSVAAIVLLRLDKSREKTDCMDMDTDRPMPGAVTWYLVLTTPWAGTHTGHSSIMPDSEIFGRRGAYRAVKMSGIVIWLTGSMSVARTAFRPRFRTVTVSEYREWPLPKICQERSATSSGARRSWPEFPESTAAEPALGE